MSPCDDVAGHPSGPAWRGIFALTKEPGLEGFMGCQPGPVRPDLHVGVRRCPSQGALGPYGILSLLLTMAFSRTEQEGFLIAWGRVNSFGFVQ